MNSTVLCVDDNRDLCRILEKALSGAGYRVITAHDGDRAIELAREEGPDLVVLDLFLPRRDGFEVLEAIRSMTPPLNQTPTLLVSDCRVTPLYQNRADELGAAALLVKPVPLDQLLALVKQHTKVLPRTRPNGDVAPPLSGTLEELGFDRLLHHLHGLRATGVLMLTSGKKRKAIQMRDGYPVAVKSNLVNECLGNHLVRRGSLSRDQLAESLGRMKKGEGLQGQILVAMEVLEEEEVGAALRAQAEEKLFEIFCWTEGQFRFEIGARLRRSHDLALDRSPASVILDGVRTRMPRERVDEFLDGVRNHFVERAETPFHRFQDIGLTPEERQLVERSSGSRSVVELLGKNGGEALRRSLYALITCEMLCLTTEARPSAPSAASQVPVDTRSERELRTELAATAERLRRQTYFDVLGVSEDASEEDVQQAYDRCVEQVHPDRFASASGSVRQLADEVYQRLSTAKGVLEDPRQRTEYVLKLRKGERRAAQEQEGRRALDAETEFQRGESLIRHRSYEDALLHFGRALEAYPQEGEYHAHYGWCLHLCHPDDSVMVEEAIEHVRRGLKLAPDREKPYLFLGRLYKVVGRGSAAEKMFTRAVQIRPDCVEAMRELRLINLRRERGKGLIKRFFRR